MTGAIHACRACGAGFGPVFCDLGQMAVANSYLPTDADAANEPRFPLRALVCASCRMVQLDHVVAAGGIFRDYSYFSSASSSWLAHAADYAGKMIGRLGLDGASWVVEVASNDGYLLQNFVAAGVPCLGVEPAENVAKVARAAGVPTASVFLDAETAAAIVRDQGRRADLVIANNVLAHVPDINSFVRGLAALLADGGTLTIESPHLLSLVDGIQFDTIYHEHYGYWSLYSLEKVLARHGLFVFDIEHLATHGGSLRLFAAKHQLPASGTLLALRKTEAARGVDGDAFYLGFDAKVRALLQGFRAWHAAQSDMGRKLAAYGAAAKGNTFLNAARMGPRDFMAVADISPAKQGRLLPGSHIPVLSPQAMLALNPDEILILPWNIAPEIVAQLRGAGYRGGLWVAVPEMRKL